MANTFILKRSSVPGKVPLPADLQVGELAINLADGLIFSKNASGVIISLGGSEGGGGGGGAASVTISDSAPALPVNGDLWWNSENGTMYIFYADVDSQQWVEAFPQRLTEGPSGTYTLDGNLTVSNDLIVEGSLFETSDATLKTNIKPISNALDVVNKLQGVTFNWVKTDKPSMGLIAQEVQAVLPQLVNTKDDGTKVLHYTAIIGLLIQSVKELSEKINGN